MPMKRNQYRCKTAVCPFYKREDVHKICCCGVVDNSSIHLAFGHDDDCKAYKTEMCRGGYFLCPVYKMLEEMYDG